MEKLNKSLVIFFALCLTLTTTMADNPTTIWTGANNAAWDNPANWTNGVPNAHDVVIAANNQAVYPVINYQADAVASVVLEANANLTIASGGFLLVGQSANSGVKLYDGAVLNIAEAASLVVSNVGENGIENLEGLVSNNGEIILENIAEAGIWNFRTFENNGLVKIDRTGWDGVHNGDEFFNKGMLVILETNNEGIDNTVGYFVNDGTIDISGTVEEGIANDSEFVNNNLIIVNNERVDEEIRNDENGEFINNGRIESKNVGDGSVVSK